VTLLWLCVSWVFASVGVAMLPMRRQYVPGVALLLAAPVLIVMIGLQMGWLIAALALAAFVSMYRNPLKFLIAKLRGQNPQVPE
jgi:ribose/xylose/arabinose/galactoside ABC-type transport system permease subunit